MQPYRVSRLDPRTRCVQDPPKRLGNRVGARGVQDFGRYGGLNFWFFPLWRHCFFDLAKFIVCIFSSFEYNTSRSQARRLPPEPQDGEAHAA